MSTYVTTCQPKSAWIRREGRMSLSGYERVPRPQNGRARCWRGPCDSITYCETGFLKDDKPPEMCQSVDSLNTSAEMKFLQRLPLLKEVFVAEFVGRGVRHWRDEESRRLKVFDGRRRRPEESWSRKFFLRFY